MTPVRIGLRRLAALAVLIEPAPSSGSLPGLSPQTRAAYAGARGLYRYFHTAGGEAPSKRHIPSVAHSRGTTRDSLAEPDMPRWLVGTEASRRSSPQLLASRIDRLPRIWRLLAGGIAGGFAGGLVAGLGARGAMRLIGMAAGEEAQGTAPTGEVVGRFTVMALSGSSHLSSPSGSLLGSTTFGSVGSYLSGG